ncbi:hypothetical protein NY406_09670 [Chlorobaculum sp. MV4-Y]|uniref:hypothetical protein n=1 Tax=Chlorobaculum sp. MV4-Y TaxID=2976335 RepID=UPI0021AE3987|nr:hypothetical protein [Chlorobaculum sp. MV4-Y]UWX57462.1 hypothetical protein NY406_09670 [Chlorobaculum sp. MV4-Y]
MGDIVLLDTSVYTNILDVPGRNQNRKEIFDDFQIRIENSDNFLLPMATIWETGNHIAHLPDGNQRRQFAEKLLGNVLDALNGKAPYRPTYFPGREVFMEWLTTREGVSLSDFSIIKEWEQTRDRHPMGLVLVWSLDSDLSGYDNGPH